MSVVLLTDAPEWCQPLLDELHNLGVTAITVDARGFRWSPSEPFPAEWEVVVNRLSARPGASVDNGLDTQSAVTMYRDLVAALELQSALTGHPKRVINGAKCHHVGVSKCVQASLFASLSIATPLTKLCTKRTPQPAPDGYGGWLVKPNVGGKGSGIVPMAESAAVETIGDDATFEADGVGVLQRVVGASTAHEAGGGREGKLHALSTGCVHRIEVLGGQVLYAAHVPTPPVVVPTAAPAMTGSEVAEKPTFNNCLGDVCQKPSKEQEPTQQQQQQQQQFNNCLSDVCAVTRGPAAPRVAVTAPADVPAHIADAALRIAAAAGMDMGSVEYLVVGDGPAGAGVSFIDINPVSTLLKSPAAMLVLGGASGHSLQARFIVSQL